MLIIGLTGGIGSGKSAAAECFRKLGITVVDADIGAREVVAKDAPALTKIADHFGSQALQEDNTLNRAYLRSIIFDNKEEKQWLESLLHPLIRQWITQQLEKAQGPYAVLESPLLLETDQHTLVARVLVIDVPEDIQIKRSALRDDNTEEQIRAIINNQMPRAQRCQKADDIIDNSGTPAELEQQVLNLNEHYIKLADLKS